MITKKFLQDEIDKTKIKLKNLNPIEVFMKGYYEGYIDALENVKRQ